VGSHPLGLFFFSEVEFGFCVTVFADFEDFFVDFGTVVVAVLTCSSDGEADGGRVPGSDAGDFAEAFVGFAREAGCAPTGCDSFVAFAFGGSNGVDEFVLVEDVVDGDFLFKEVFGEVDFGVGVASVDLDFHDVGFLLAEFDEAGLSVGNYSNDGTIFLHASEFSVYCFSFILSPFLCVLGESLSLTSVPIFVQSSQELFR